MTLPFAQATLPVEMTPGGDFTWLAKGLDMGFPAPAPAPRRAWRRETRPQTSSPADFGMVADTRLTAAPADVRFDGPFLHQLSRPARQVPHAGHGGQLLHHGEGDPHSGSYGADPNATFAVGAYRILAGVGYAPASQPSVPAFTGKADDRGGEQHLQPDGEHLLDPRVVRRGSSDWCANCHNAMHSVLSPSRCECHPTNVNLGGTIAANYNAYIMSGNSTGSGATAFTFPHPLPEGQLHAELGARHLPDLHGRPGCRRPGVLPHLPPRCTRAAGTASCGSATATSS